MRKFHWKSIALGVAVGVIFYAAGLQALHGAKYIENHSEPSETALALPLRPLQIDPSWIKAGEPKFQIAWYAKTRNQASGVWSCDGPSTFEWSFSQDEQVYILEGTVDVTYMGKQFTLQPGDNALFLANTKATWHVPKYVKKSFTVQQPNLAVRLYRQMFGVA